MKGFSQNTVLLDYYSTKDKPFNTLLQKYEEKTKHKDFDKSIKEALKQLKDKAYYKEIKAMGYNNILELAIVSDGKEVKIQKR